jgi:hypothetical protein
MTQREAAEKMGLTTQWVRKLIKRMKKQGDAKVVHVLCGRLFADVDLMPFGPAVRRAKVGPKSCHSGFFRIVKACFASCQKASDLCCAQAGCGRPLTPGSLKLPTQLPTQGGIFGT